MLLDPAGVRLAHSVEPHQEAASSFANGDVHIPGMFMNESMYKKKLVAAPSNATVTQKHMEHLKKGQY